MPDLLIAGGTLLDPASRTDGRRDILIRGGKIRSLLKSGTRRPKDAQVLDASGCWVVPGLIDLHVHLRDLGQKEDETIETGTLAAARGGVTTVLAMPNTRPVIDTPRRLREISRRADAAAAVNVLFAGAVTLGQKGEVLTDLPAIARAGAAAFSDDGRPVMNAELMRRVLAASRKLGLPVLDHAEDDHLAGGGVVHDGAFAARRRLPGIPASSESLMSLRDIELARLTGGHLHICHVSCAETVALVREAKRRGLRVTAEAAPHHFTLADTDIDDKRSPDFKMKPPLRSSSDRRALREGLADGTLDAVATDHAPHAPSKKARGILKAPFGVIGLETLLPLSLALWRSGEMSRLDLVSRLSWGPARVLGLSGKGRIAPGADADVTVIDPDLRWTVSETSASKSRNTPFLGKRMRGAARAAVVAGRVVHALEAAG